MANKWQQLNSAIVEESMATRLCSDYLTRIVDHCVCVNQSINQRNNTNEE
jgi:hypothetical protein